MIDRPTDVMVPPNMQNEFIKKLNSNKLTYNITLDNVQRYNGKFLNTCKQLLKTMIFFLNKG